jgi:hypothetical protein
MSRLTDRYKASKSAKVGTECVCPACGVKFIKTNYQQAFCKSKAGTKCKDKYWNTVTPEKRNNTTRISPANAAFYHTRIAPFYNDNERDDDVAPDYDDGLDYLLECGCRGD